LSEDSPVAAWRLDMVAYRCSGEFLSVPQRQSYASEANAIQIRRKEQAFQSALAAAAATNPTSKEAWFPLFEAGVSLMEAMASAKHGWPAGGARVARDFDAAWMSGMVDFVRLWPRPSFRS